MPFEDPYTYDTINAEDAVVTNAIQLTDAIQATIQPVTFVSQEELKEALDDFAKRIYKILDEMTNIEISEEEFMKILKEGE